MLNLPQSAEVDGFKFKARIALLRHLLALPAPSGREDAMVNFLKSFITRRGVPVCGTMVTDRHNNVYIRKGDPGIVPFVAAHLDSVQNDCAESIVRREGRLFGLNKQGQRVGIGADNKTGIYVCLELLEKFDDIGVVLFASEEIGCVGAKNAPEEWFKDAGYLIEFDCPGKGLVSYTSGGERMFANHGEFIKKSAPVMKKHGLTRWQHHPLSDVQVVRQRFHFSCLNLSSGYYNWHQPDEFLVISEVEAAVTAGEELIWALGNHAYPFDAKRTDDAPPLYPVTGLNVVTPVEPKPKKFKMKAKTVEIENPGQSNLDEVLAQFNPENLEDDGERNLLRQDFAQCLPSDIPFFTWSMMNPLLRRAFHMVDLSGEFKVKELLAEHQDRIYRSELSLGRNGNGDMYRILLRFDQHTFAYMNSSHIEFYALTANAALKLAQGFRRYLKPHSVREASYYIISIDHGRPTADQVYIDKSPPVDVEDLALHYGADFPSWEKMWLERLNRKRSGLSIFHGPPGCGKTYFLRTVAARMVEKAAIYVVPLSEVELLSSPCYVKFWVEQTRKHNDKLKIVILEDAEELLLPRDCGNRDRVSNLLNIADGFLGDHLKIQVIATTNAMIRQLDPAVLRPGRMVGEREFRRLTREEAFRLAQAKGLVLEDQADYSLAEIYNGSASTVDFNADRQVGFIFSKTR